MLSRVFNRIQNPHRFFRFHKTALIIAGLSWLPFIYGLYTGTEVVKETVVKAVASDPRKPIKAVFHESVSTAQTPSKVGSSIALIAASYVIGYGAMAYYGAGMRYRPENAFLRSLRTLKPWA